MDSVQLEDLFYILKKKLLWIICIAIICAGGAYTVSRFVISPKYMSSVSLYVFNNAITNSENVNLNDISAAQKLVNTYIVILENNQILSEVGDSLSVHMTAKELKNSLTMESENNTEVLKITAKTTNPELSAEICNKIAEVAPDVLKRVVKAGAVEVINIARAADMPSSPDIKKNTVIGGFFGIVVSYLVFLMYYVLDNTIKGEEDLKKHIDVPVIGEIPNFDKYIHKGKK